MSSTPEPDSSDDRRLRDGLGDVGRAFFDHPSLTTVQRSCIRPIAEGGDVLACAATAAGKTEAVLGPLMWRLRQNATVADGPRLLAIAPTRALVADLVARLEPILGRLGWSCAGQTSDLRGKHFGAEVLVTTPESLDSMLVRDVRREHGVPCGHLLADVGAIFVDEAHCFDATARGDQLIFLLARLRRLRQTARDNGWSSDAAIQICGASATVPGPEMLARRLLGPPAHAIVCPGTRPIDILTSSGWRALEADLAPTTLAAEIAQEDQPREIATLLWRALESAENRKALVFVPSRRLCDSLAAELRRELLPRRELWLGAHHGSLGPDVRRAAERDFQAHRDAVLVATNTLEVGVDIGDVDLVALLGAPPDTASLLQRIGRGGRRSNLTRVLPLARHAADAAALASQLICAARGEIDLRVRFRRWDVFPQQVISYVRQNGDLGRARAAITELAATAWPAADTTTLADGLLDDFVEDGRLREDRSRLHLGEAWQDYAPHADGEAKVHSNISSGPVGFAIRDELTGDLLSHVASPSPGARHLTVAGRRHRIVQQGEEIIVAPVGDDARGSSDDAPNYGGRRRPVSEAFAAHLRRGSGLDERSAPLVPVEDGWVWFHFGGDLFERCLRLAFPKIVGTPAIRGVALWANEEALALPSRPPPHPALLSAAPRLAQDALQAEGGSPFAAELSLLTWRACCDEIQIIPRFASWLASRECCIMNGADAACLRRLLV